MKQSFFYLCMLFFFFSCGNESDLSISKNDLTPELNNSPIIDPIDHMKVVNATFDTTGYMFSSDQPSSYGMNNLTYYGYSNISIFEQNQKYLWNNSNNDGTGLVGAYICDRINVIKRIPISSGAILMALSSPLCGYIPGIGGRGYAGTTEGGDFVMITWLYHIKYDMNGRAINKYIPRIGQSSSSLNDLVWNVGIYTP